MNLCRCSKRLLFICSNLVIFFIFTSTIPVIFLLRVNEYIELCDYVELSHSRMTSWLRLSSQCWRQEQLDNQPQILLIFCGTNESLWWNKHSSYLFILIKKNPAVCTRLPNIVIPAQLRYWWMLTDSFRGLIFHANWSRWGWMTVALGHVVDQNQRFWLEGWRCYCIEGRNAAGGTKKASKNWPSSSRIV